MKNNCQDKFDNITKGMILEKVVSHALLNNGIEHEHNPLESQSEYVWGAGTDHYLTELKIAFECKNLSRKTTKNISPAWLKEEVLERGKVKGIVFSFNLKPSHENYLRENGVEYFFYIGCQVTPKNVDVAENLLSQLFDFYFNLNGKIIVNDVGVCNSGFIISYFIDYLLVSYVFDCIVNVFYMIIDDKPKINDPPDNKNNKIIDVWVSETNNKCNITFKKTDSNNKFYLNLNPNKIISKIKNRLKPTNHRLINCLNKNANKINPNRLFYEKRSLLPFASFG